MRTLKFIGAGVFALFTLGTILTLLGTILLVASGASSSYMMGRLCGGMFGVILWSVLSYACWKSATKPQQTNDRLVPPLPGVPPDKR